MGCGSSRTVLAIEHNRPTSRQDTKRSSKKNQVVPNQDSQVTASKDINHNIIHVSPTNSLTDVNNFAKRREISASSTRTADSGISELRENIITENSDTNRQEKASDRPNTPELVLEGRACPRLQSGKEKRRLELEKKNSESTVPKLPPLGDGSLLERPKTRGITFDIMLCPETGNIKKTPSNLPKLEKRKRRKKLTKEEIEEKMRKATERRQEHREKIIKKSQAFYGHYGNSDDIRPQLSERRESQEKHVVENDEKVQEKDPDNCGQQLQDVEDDL